METTIFFAQFLGWYFLIFGLISLLRKEAFIEKQFKLAQDKEFLLLSGYLALIMGLVIVILHNVWVADWRVIITVVGWVSLGKGIMLIAFPRVAQKLISVLKSKFLFIQIATIAMGLIGAFLVWMSH